MDVCSSYFDNHLRIYVNETIMLFTLNLHSDICQVYLNKTERMKIAKMPAAFLHKVKKEFESINFSN